MKTLVVMIAVYVGLCTMCTVYQSIRTFETEQELDQCRLERALRR